MLWPGLVRSVPAVSPRSRIMRRTRCTPPLVLTTFLSDLPFAVTIARLFPSLVHGLDHIGVFLVLLVLISFSPVWRTLQRPCNLRGESFFFCFAVEERRDEMRGYLVAWAVLVAMASNQD